MNNSTSLDPNLVQLQHLTTAHGRGTGLVTYYVPAGSDLWLTVDQLKREQKTATNIKDRRNSKAVSKAITYMLSYLKTTKHVPDTGMALFSGYSWWYIWRERYRKVWAGVCGFNSAPENQASYLSMRQKVPHGSCCGTFSRGRMLRYCVCGRDGV